MLDDVKGRTAHRLLQAPAVGRGGYGAPKPVRDVVLNVPATSDIDASAEVVFGEVLDGLHERSLELHVARATDELRARFDEVGLTEEIGPDHFHGTVAAAVMACQGTPGEPANTPPEP